jgi:hypothetical protein
VSTWGTARLALGGTGDLERDLELAGSLRRDLLGGLEEDELGGAAGGAGGSLV